MYTAVGVGGYHLAVASSQTPLDPASWTRYGPVIPASSGLQQGSKSGAILLRPSPPHYLMWGDSEIRWATSTDLITWNASAANVLLAPRNTSFDSQLVESGPPPLLLSTGDYLFLHNSANTSLAYHVSWAILDGQDPTNVLARASQPLLSPTLPWQIGAPPALCNVPNVVFLEAAAPVPGQVDTFYVWFGGSDASVGTAIISVQSS
jgi:beta-1,2-mannosidase